MLSGSLRTVFGWTIHVGPEANHRALRNFPMQATGAELMRLAACIATENGVPVCAPVHDAFVLCSPLDSLDLHVEQMKAAMAEASRVVLDGFELTTDAKLVRWPERYMDKRGAVMWDKVVGIIYSLEEIREERDLSLETATVACAKVQQFAGAAS
jgi:DNA polymerase-1